MTAPAQADDQPEHVGEIVSGVGDQRHRVGGEAEDDLDGDERDVERDADREGPAEIVAVMLVVRMAVRPCRRLAEPSAASRKPPLGRK